MDLHVKFDGHEIIVTRPETDMMTAYRKRPDSPNLVLTRSWLEPTVSSPEISEFRAHAFQAAVAKARELGWIVVRAAGTLVRRALTAREAVTCFASRRVMYQAMYNSADRIKPMRD